jgi:mycothiol synthase
MTIPGLPAGYAVRRPTLADGEAILAVVHAAERDALGRDDSTLAEVHELLRLPRTPTETDHWLVEANGRAAAWGMVIDGHGGENVDLDVYSDPVQPEQAAALRARGFVIERRFNQLRVELDPGRPFPSAPHGLALDRFDPTSDSDWKDWHDVLQSSFVKHWGYEPMDLSAFRESVTAEDDPEFGRWRFAVVDGARAGICQASGRFAVDEGGWIRYLGILPAARGRGAARYLLGHVLALYAADGRRWAGLTVDTENVTGALRLYESAGMRPWMQIDAFRRRVYADG